MPQGTRWDRWKRHCIVMALAALTAGGAAARIIRPSRGEEVYGRFSRAQMEARAREVVKQLEDGAPIRTTLRPQPAYDRAGGLRPLWVAEGVDPTGEYACLLLWDAETGELVSAGRFPPKPRWGAERALDGREAAAVSGTWLARLGVRRAGRPWRVDSAPERCGSTWYVTWRCGGRRMAVMVHALSGQLVGATEIATTGSAG